MVINKKAYHNYDIKDTIEAGIVLSGQEVKSIRDGRVQFDDSFVKNVSGELVLINADISRYKYSSDDKYDSKRTRKLLLHKSEIYNLASKCKQGNLVLVPLKLYSEKGKIKLLIGIGRGMKKFEKKNVEKERTMDKELHREQRKYMVK